MSMRKLLMKDYHRSKKDQSPSIRTRELFFFFHSCDISNVRGHHLIRYGKGFVAILKYICGTIFFPNYVVLI